MGGRGDRERHDDVIERGDVRVPVPVTVSVVERTDDELVGDGHGHPRHVVGPGRPIAPLVEHDAHPSPSGRPERAEVLRAPHVDDRGGVWIRPPRAGPSRVGRAPDAASTRGDRGSRGAPRRGCRRSAPGSSTGGGPGRARPAPPPRGDPDRAGPRRAPAARPRTVRRRRSVPRSTPRTRQRGPTRSPGAGGTGRAVGRPRLPACPLRPWCRGPGPRTDRRTQTPSHRRQSRASRRMAMAHIAGTKVDPSGR